MIKLPTWSGKPPYNLCAGGATIADDDCNITVVPSFPRHLLSPESDHSCVVQPGAGSRLHVHEDWVRVDSNSLTNSAGREKPELPLFSFLIHYFSVKHFIDSNGPEDQVNNLNFSQN